MRTMYAVVVVAALSTLVSSSSLAEDICSAELCPGPRLAALIPARTGSKGIPRKNLSQIGNETLLARTVRIVRQTGRFTSVWVSTDGRDIADEAAASGAQVHWRNAATATDDATTISAVEDFLRAHPDFDAIAVVQCTSPFLRSEFLSDAVRKIETGEFDCVFSATRVFHLRWTDGEGTFAKPLNFDPKMRPRRQDWSGELIENGMFYLVRKLLVTRDGVLQNDRCGIVEVPKMFSLEVDTQSDLVMAREMLKVVDG